MELTGYLGMSFNVLHYAQAVVLICFIYVSQERILDSTSVSELSLENIQNTTNQQQTTLETSWQNKEICLYKTYYNFKKNKKK